MLTMALLTMTRLVRRRLLGSFVAAHHHAVRVQMDVRLAIVSIAASVSVAMVYGPLGRRAREPQGS